MSVLTGAQLSTLLRIQFSDEQLAAITAPLEPAVIVAGAGTGKTTVMAARVVWLVASGLVRPDEVLGLTFTRKAAAELGQRIRRALITAGVLLTADIDAGGEPLVLTYDAFAGRLVGEHGLRAGLEDDPVMITGASRFRLGSRVVTATAAPVTHLSRLRPDTVTERLLSLDAEMQAHLVDPTELADQSEAAALELANAPLNRLRKPYASVKQATQALAERLELGQLGVEYQDLKRRLGYVEFADQMAAAARLARAVPDVGATLRGQFRVVLLDEYQDTSAAQAEVLASVFSGPEVVSGLGHPVTAVGDPYQAIYGWRGAAASNILGFPAAFRTGDRLPARQYALTVNRRSGPLILAAANQLARPLAADPLLASDGVDHHLRAPDGTSPGTIRAASFETWREEVDFIADGVVAAREEGRIASWAEAAVLVRRNAHIGALYSGLLQRGVPVEIVGLGGLLTVPEVADVVSTLRLLADVTADADTVRLLTGPRWRVGSGDLALLGRRVRQLGPPPSLREQRATLAQDLDDALAHTESALYASLLEAAVSPGDLPYSAEARQRLAAFVSEYEGLARHAAEPVEDLVRRCIATLGLATELAVSREATTDQLAAFAQAVAAYVRVDGDASLAGLLSYLDAERDHGTGLEQDVPSAGDSVKLLTVHRAKGLEWDAVWLPALTVGVFPSDRVTTNWLKNAAVLPSELRGDAGAIPQVPELTDAAAAQYAADLTTEARRAEDRLAYVAATRARQLLTVSTHTWEPELVRPRGPSDYFRAVAEHADVVHLAPPIGDVNPIVTQAVSLAWPAALDADGVRRRQTAAALVRKADGSDADLDANEAATVAAWDDLLDHLAAEAASELPPVVPEYLPVTVLDGVRRSDPALLEQWRRPMPRLRGAAARTGERFHAWVEGRFVQDRLLGEPDEVDAALASLQAAFEAGLFASREPLSTEVAFSLSLAGRLIRGRIDAVFAEGEGYLVIDWKTGTSGSYVALQLAAYRVAWAELVGVPVDKVRAAFFEVATGTLVEPPTLPDRAGLERLMAGLP